MASQATKLVISEATLQYGLHSSTATSRPVLRTLARMASVSSGEMVRGSMTSTEIPSLFSLSATWFASITMRERATMVTSVPSRVTFATPNGMV